MDGTTSNNPRFKYLVVQVMVRAWQTGSLRVAMSELELIIREERSLRLEESTSNADWFSQNRSVVRNAARKVSLRKPNFNSSSGVEEVLERRRVSQDAVSAPPHRAQAA